MTVAFNKIHCTTAIPSLKVIMLSREPIITVCWPDWITFHRIRMMLMLLMMMMRILFCIIVFYVSHFASTVNSTQWDIQSMKRTPIHRIPSNQLTFFWKLSYIPTAYVLLYMHSKYSISIVKCTLNSSFLPKKEYILSRIWEVCLYFVK